jgi:integrase/recombinase XerC
MYTRKHYAAGEKACHICGTALPAFSCWAGRTNFYCNTPECRKAHYQRVCHLTIGENEKPCSRPGCTGFAPAGEHHPRTKHFFCSAECKKKSIWFLSVPWSSCDWCGGPIRRPKRSQLKHRFCSAKCTHLFRSDGIIRDRAGSYFPLLTEYIDSFVQFHYRNSYGARNALSYLFQFLLEEKITDISQVTPRTITRFMAWEGRRGGISNKYISFASTFFDWMIAEGRREHANPVISKIHHCRTPERLPRPYSDEEMAEIEGLLEERGNNRVRLAFYIGLEAGLRISEVCRLRTGDVDLTKQTIFVGIPNKTMSEGTSHFHLKTRKYFELWMAERNPNCGHDFLLHNSLGRPCNQNSLQLEFRRVLCVWERKGGKTPKKANDTGLDDFHFHRLRHRMASSMVAGGADMAAVMGQGRWATATAACGYIRVSSEQSCRSYNEAMERSKTKRHIPQKRTSGFGVYRDHKKTTT